MSKQLFFDWCIEKHVSRNLNYNGYLPYKFHLDLVHKSACEFEVLWGIINEKHYKGKVPFEVIECGCYSHDLISDTGTTYNDIVKTVNNIYSLPVAVLLRDFSIFIPEIARAVCEDIRGRNRDERMPDYIYHEIRNTPGATMVKLADRLGNVKFGHFMGGTGMYKKYQKEHKHFKEMLYHEDYKPIWDRIEHFLFDENIFG